MIGGYCNLNYEFWNGEEKFYENLNEVNGNAAVTSLTYYETGHVEVRFKCPKCNYVIIEEFIEFLPPDLASETISDSEALTGSLTDCNQCQTSYDITLSNRLDGLFISIDKLPLHWKFFFKVFEKPYHNHSEDEID